MTKPWSIENSGLKNSGLKTFVRLYKVIIHGLTCLKRSLKLSMAVPVYLIMVLCNAKVGLYPIDFYFFED